MCKCICIDLLISDKSEGTVHVDKVRDGPAGSGLGQASLSEEVAGEQGNHRSQPRPRGWYFVGSSVILTCRSSSSALQLPYRSQLPVLANLADGYVTKASMEVPRLRSSSRSALSATPAAGQADFSQQFF